MPNTILGTQELGHSQFRRSMAKSRLPVATFVIVFLILLSPSAALHFARASGPWYVATTGDDVLNDCLTPATPCASINGALAKPGFTDEDTIKVAIGTYYGTGDQVVLLTRSATLSGGWDPLFVGQTGMSTIDGQGARRGVTLDGNARIEKFTVQNGTSWAGGGIDSTGVLTLTDSIVRNNSALYNGGIGLLYGGLIVNSIVTENKAGREGICGGGGGGIGGGGFITLYGTTVSNNTLYPCSDSSGIAAGGVANELTLNNSTISGNTNGPAISSDYGILNLSNSTITKNHAGVIIRFGTMNIQNSILANNDDAYGGSIDCDDSYGGATNSLGYNIIRNSHGCSLANTDRSGIDPLLGILQNNGGSTQTHALSSLSPALNSGNPTGCFDHLGNLLSTDQRGMPRLDRCDIGAFEYQGPILYSFLPLVNKKPVPTATPIPPTYYDIHGSVNDNGFHASGVSLELRFYNGSAWSTFATVNTGADGSYAFLNTPRLNPGQAYYVRYLNPDNNDSSRLCCWFTRTITSDTASTNVPIGDFDITDIHLASSYYMHVGLPFRFEWWARPTARSDSYEFNLFDPGNPNTHWNTLPLGYDNGYILNNLPPGFSTYQDYGWYMAAWTPDGGYGESFYYYTVYFINTGSAPRIPASVRRSEIPNFLKERRLPILRVR